MTVPFKFKQQFRDLYEFSSQQSGRMTAGELTTTNSYFSPQFSDAVLSKHSANCPLSMDGFMSFIADGKAETNVGFDEITWGYVHNFAKQNLFAGSDTTDLKSLRVPVDATVKNFKNEPDLTKMWATHCGTSGTASVAGLVALLKEMCSKMPMLDIFRCLLPKGGKKPAAATAVLAVAALAATPKPPAEQPASPTKAPDTPLGNNSNLPSPKLPPPPPPPSKKVVAEPSSAAVSPPAPAVPSAVEPSPAKQPPPPPPTSTAPPRPADGEVASPLHLQTTRSQLDDSITETSPARWSALQAPSPALQAPQRLVALGSPAPADERLEDDSVARTSLPVNLNVSSRAHVSTPTGHSDGFDANQLPSSSSFAMRAPDPLLMSYSNAGLAASTAMPGSKLAPPQSRSAVQPSSAVPAATNKTTVGVSCKLEAEPLPRAVVEIVREIDAQRDELQRQLDEELLDLQQNSVAVDTLRTRLDQLKARRTATSADIERARLETKLEKFVREVAAQQQALKHSISTALRGQIAEQEYARLAAELGVPTSNRNVSLTATFEDNGAVRLQSVFDAVRAKEKEVAEKEALLRRMRKMEREEERIVAELKAHEEAVRQRAAIAAGAGAAEVTGAHGRTTLMTRRMDGAAASPGTYAIPPTGEGRRDGYVAATPFGYSTPAGVGSVNRAPTNPYVGGAARLTRQSAATLR
jgi:hypothetical protein